MTRWRLAFGLALGAVAGFLACGGTASHVFQGHLYEPARDCIDPLTAIDVLAGPDPGLGCDPVCLVGTSTLLGDGGAKSTYVTNMCPPYPPNFDQPEESAACAPAIAALHRNDLCADSGSSNPRQDAAPDAADPAGSDASPLDAGADSSVQDASVQDASVPDEDDAAPDDDAGPIDAAIE